jgi:protein-S-isoprenylcysteine O-methyltransferase Ste14
VQKQTYRRQILAGDAVRPSPDPWARGSGKLPMTLLQRNFLLVALILLVIGVVLIFMELVLLATVPLFLLALALIAGRFVF